MVVNYNGLFNRVISKLLSNLEQAMVLTDEVENTLSLFFRDELFDYADDSDNEAEANPESEATSQPDSDEWKNGIPLNADIYDLKEVLEQVLPELHDTVDKLEQLGVIIRDTFIGDSSVTYVDRSSSKKKCYLKDANEKMLDKLFGTKEEFNSIATDPNDVIIGADRRGQWEKVNFEPKYIEPIKIPEENVTTNSNIQET